MSLIKIKCPKCKTENTADVLKAEEGSRILCRGCNEFITIQFKGKTPKDIIDELKKAVPKKIEIGLI